MNVRILINLKPNVKGIKFSLNSLDTGKAVSGRDERAGMQSINTGIDVVFVYI